MYLPYLQQTRIFLQIFITLVFEFFSGSMLASVILNEKLGNFADESILEKLQSADKHRRSYYADLSSFTFNHT